MCKFKIQGDMIISGSGQVIAGARTPIKFRPGVPGSDQVKPGLPPFYPVKPGQSGRWPKSKRDPRPLRGSGQANKDWTGSKRESPFPVFDSEPIHEDMLVGDCWIGDVGWWGILEFGDAIKCGHFISKQESLELVCLFWVRFIDA